jgi:hypothetical protein
VPPPPEPAFYTLRIARDQQAPNRDFEVLIEALGTDGAPLNLPRLAVTMPKGQAVIDELNFDKAYAPAASFRVIDWSPFPRECRAGRCVFPISQQL